MSRNIATDSNNNAATVDNAYLQSLLISLSTHTHKYNVVITENTTAILEENVSR